MDRKIVILIARNLVAINSRIYLNKELKVKFKKPTKIKN